MRYQDWEAVRRVLAVRTGTAADVLLLGPALRSLKGALSGAHLTLLTSTAGQAGAELLPWVDEVVVHDAVWDDEPPAARPVDIEGQLDLVELMEARQCDAAVIFTSHAQSPWPAAYAAYLARIPLRLAQSKEGGGAILTHNARSLPDDAHEIDRHLFLLEAAGLPVAGRHLDLHVPERAQAATERLLVQSRVPPGEPFVVLAPGVSGARGAGTARSGPGARAVQPVDRGRYPARFHAEICRSVAAETGLPVVVVGTRAGIRFGAQIVAEATGTDSGGGYVISVAGQTSLAELAALVERANLVVTSPTVVMHLADAFRRPLVATFVEGAPLTRVRPRAAPATLLQLPRTIPENVALSASVVATEAVQRLDHSTGWVPTTAAPTLALEPQVVVGELEDEDEDDLDDYLEADTVEPEPDWPIDPAPQPQPRPWDARPPGRAPAPPSPPAPAPPPAPPPGPGSGWRPGPPRWRHVVPPQPPAYDPD